MWECRGRQINHNTCKICFFKKVYETFFIWIIVYENNICGGRNTEFKEALQRKPFLPLFYDQTGEGEGHVQRLWVDETRKEDLRFHRMHQHQIRCYCCTLPFLSACITLWQPLCYRRELKGWKKVVMFLFLRKLRYQFSNTS